MKKPRVMIKFYQQDFQGRQGNSIQKFGNDLSDIQDNLSKIETRVQGNANKDSEISQQIEVIEQRIGNSSDRITSNTNAAEALKVGW